MVALAKLNEAAQGRRISSASLGIHRRRAPLCALLVKLTGSKRADEEKPVKTSIICIAALTLIGTIIGASPAQRCPAGHDAFLNCLPLDHRYGGPGEISRPQLQRAQAYVRQGPYRNDPAYLACIRSRTTAAIKRGDPRALRSAEETRARGTAIGTPAFQSLLRENERACGRAR